MFVALNTTPYQPGEADNALRGNDSTSVQFYSPNRLTILKPMVY